MANTLDWQTDGKDWPHREASRFVNASGLRWHVQTMGTGPVLVLVHGTGAATHSWRGLMPLLAEKFTVLAMDLPGHGFTQFPSDDTQLSLPGMAQALHDLLSVMEVNPVMVVGHSAGAAILAQMCLDNFIQPKHLLSVNGALLPLSGIAGEIFSPIAKLFAATSLVPRLFSWRAEDPAVVKRLIDGTGSTLDAEGIALYGRLIRNSGHAAAALGMMAQWDLHTLQRDLPTLATMLTLVVGSNDKTIQPSEAQRVLALMPQAKLITLNGLGHLAHEEQPQQIADIVASLMKVT